MTDNNSKHSKIRKKALKLLEKYQEGLRYTELRNKISEAFPELILNTIQGGIWNLHLKFPNDVFKPERGIFKLIKYQDVDETVETPTKFKEEDFYEPFADYLVQELEATSAIPLGGNIFREEWNTPDVFGINKSAQRDIIQYPTEIISVEIKLDPLQLIKAFGQACAYRLFSHKTYLVIPNNSSDGNLVRINSLCLIYGIGLVLFDNSNTENPDWDIKNRPLTFEPDIFYTNNLLKKLENKRPDLFKKLGLD